MTAYFRCGRCGRYDYGSHQCSPLVGTSPPMSVFTEYQGEFEKTSREQFRERLREHKAERFDDYQDALRTLADVVYYPGAVWTSPTALVAHVIERLTATSDEHDAQPSTASDLNSPRLDITAAVERERREHPLRRVSSPEHRTADALERIAAALDDSDERDEREADQEHIKALAESQSKLRNRAMSLRAALQTTVDDHYGVTPALSESHWVEIRQVLADIPRTIA